VRGRGEAAPSIPRLSTCRESTSGWPTWARVRGTDGSSQIRPLCETREIKKKVCTQAGQKVS
jgi:hypothetical protein